MGNKKLASIAAILMLAAGATNAAGAFDCTRGYFGGEISVYNKTKYNSSNTADLNNFKTADTDSTLAIQKSEPGINVFAGLRFNQYLGGEIGLGFLKEATAGVQNGNSATSKVSNIYLDGVGYLPVSANTDLLGTIGVGGLKADANVTNATFQDRDSLTKVKIGYRFGAGAQYNWNRFWAMRGLVRYQSGNANFLKSNTSISIGGLYTFG